MVQGYTEHPRETYSPTPMLQSVRAMLSIACEHGWAIKLADVSTAFLHAAVVEPTFVEPPKCLMLPENVCWWLNKALYGLKSAPRSWNQHLAEVMMSGGWKQSVVEQSAFYHHTDGKLDGMVVVYVDDIIACGHSQVVDDMFRHLQQCVTIPEVETLGSSNKVSFLGFDYYRKGGGVVIDPSVYVCKLLEANGMLMCKPLSTPGVCEKECDDDRKVLGVGDHKIFRRVVGQLLWLGVVRPDIKFAVKELSKRVHQPRVGDARRAKRLLRYVAGTRDMACLIRPTGNDSGQAKIDVWTDADLGGCDDTRRSTSGGVIFLNGAMIHVWSKQ